MRVKELEEEVYVFRGPPPLPPRFVGFLRRCIIETRSYIVGIIQRGRESFISDRIASAVAEKVIMDINIAPVL